MKLSTAQVVNDKDLAQAMVVCNPFLSQSQHIAMINNCYGEEGQYFVDKFKALAKLINEMPVTYQNRKGFDSMVYLHYFIGGSDFYITEKDIEGGVLQAYGYAVLNGDFEMAELGYISIADLSKYFNPGTKAVIELDLNFEPVVLSSIISQKKIAA